jgi:hypothetical protein
VNEQNYRYCPQQLDQKPLHSGIAKFGIVGLYFFQVTVTSARYIEMLNTFLLRELGRPNVNMQQIWFQQDGTTAHTARASVRVVRDM